MINLEFDLWLESHPLFEGLVDSNSGDLWAKTAEGMAALIYAVPSFLGITLAKSDAVSRPLLAGIWDDELGKGNLPAHPVLFENFHIKAISLWGKFPKLHSAGVQAAMEMIDLCGSDIWPIGVSAMKAHESQFPTAYSKILPRAIQLLGKEALFFEVHSLADIEHTSVASKLIYEAVSREIVTKEQILISYDKSKNILLTLMDTIWQYDK